MKGRCSSVCLFRSYRNWENGRKQQIILLSQLRFVN